MRTAFTVRQVEPEDAFRSDYCRLRILLWPECREECDREVAEIFSRPDLWAVFVVVLDERMAVGFLEVHLRDYAEGAIHSPVAYVEGWFVLADYRRQGFGGALMQAAENWAVARGCRELGSDTQITNDLSVTAHCRLGFQEVERLVVFLKRLR